MPFPLLPPASNAAGAATPAPGDGIPAAELPYYVQQLDWTPCEKGFQCATVKAPMDWSQPGGDDIHLALIMHRATGTRLGSLFTDPGGPGASGYEFVRDQMSNFSDSLQQHYDVVGWDPRGVGRSSAVTCFTDPKDMDDFVYGIAKSNPVTQPQQWIAESDAAGKKFADACTANTGELLQYIDTASTVHDLDLLRSVVGDPKLDYLGFSYGTDIGSAYIDEFPSRTGRIVLDGVTDPELSLFDMSLQQSKGFENAFEHYLTQCRPKFGSDCPFTGDLQTDLSTVRALYDQLDAHPVKAPDGRYMDAGVLDTAMNMALYDESYWQYLNVLFSEVEQGQTHAAFILADAYFERNTDGTYANNMTEAFLAIYCVDYPVETDLSVLADEEAQFKAATPYTYRYSPPHPDNVCAQWPYHYLGGPKHALSGAGAAPFLVVDTTGDPATPYEWGEKVAESMPSAHLVTNNGEGHTAYGPDNACIQRVVDAFLVDGTVPASDPQCNA